MTGSNAAPAGDGGGMGLLEMLDAVGGQGQGESDVEDGGVSDVTHDFDQEITSPEDVADDRQEGDPPADDKTKAGENEADEEGFIEIPASEDGGEARRIKVADAVAAFDELQGLEGKLTEVLSAAEERTQARAREIWEAQDKAFGETLQVLGTWRHGLVQMAPQKPSQDLLNRNSQNYDPELFYSQMAAYDQVVNAFGQINQQFQAAEAERTRLSNEQKTQFAQAEVERLFRRDPEWRTNFEAKTKETRDLMRDKYGIGEDVLAGLLHHGFYLAAADLVKYHALLAGSKETKAKVEKAAPKLVRSQRESAARATSQNRGKDGRYVGQAGKALESGPYTAEKGRAYFKSLIDAGAL